MCRDIELWDDPHSSVVSKLEELPHLLLRVDHVLAVRPGLTEPRQGGEAEREALGVREVPVEDVQFTEAQTLNDLEVLHERKMRGKLYRLDGVDWYEVPDCVH